jgi:signal transduction histidine kinase
MDHLQKIISQTRTRLATILLINNLLLVSAWLVAEYYLQLDKNDMFVFVGAIAGVALLLVAWISAPHVIRPLQIVWEAVLHIAPDTANQKAPDLKRVHYGRELVTAMVSHIYQIANVAQTVENIAKNTQHDLSSDFVANSLPLPMMVLGKDMNIIFANEALLRYTGRTTNDTVGQNVYLVLDMLFSNQHTFDNWLEAVRGHKVTATRTWERVRLNLPEKKETRSCDLVAYYNSGNPEGFEIMLTLFDRTRQYSQDEQAMSFLALAVHELRTPLTLLRGYIDVFEEELGGKLTPELADYLNKMKPTAQQINGFIGNVLNVARFENDQLTLKLREEQWAPLLEAAVKDVELRAKVRGIHFILKIGNNLPTVGADAVSIYEVITNLIDNAIKYSKPNGEVIIRSHLTTDGKVETTVQDAGVGIPETAMGNLFDKFYRDYRNRSQVGGTGMGLYLCKAIISAHGGNIWVRSKEGQGSTFGFTVQPYANLEHAEKENEDSVTRTAHGWIKNHSMYRR